MEMSQVGFSASYSQLKEVLMLGAVGAYDWNGTVVQETSEQTTIFPSDAFEKFFQERNQTSYLGYSIAVLSNENTIYFVAGAPRSNYTGRIVVYEIDDHGNIIIVHSQKGEQASTASAINFFFRTFCLYIGSYFGSVVCSVDVNGDSVTDVLLVGAPMFMNDFKKEEGRVYMFSVTKGILGKRELLEGPPGLENARYGSAITDVSDIDLDGFNDVIVGAPLENENVGAIYIYNGKQRTIHTKYSQKISGSDPAFGQRLHYFGRSIDARSDLNDDGITDVSVGAEGNVIQLWSHSIADVSIHISPTPKKINLLNKNTEVILQICFSAAFRPNNSSNQVDVSYNLTLDADLLSYRVTSRGLFKENNERSLQSNIIVHPIMKCTEHAFNAQEPSDAVDPLNVRVDISLKNPGSSPVLDETSPASVSHSIPFIKDCGDDEVCNTDLVLDVQQKTHNGKQHFIINSKNKKIIFNAKLRNKNENAYNTRVQIAFSQNLFFASSSAPVDGTEVSCHMTAVPQLVICQIGYPVFKAGQQVSFDITFDFNLNSLQNLAVLSFQALSASYEEDDTNNLVNLTVPLRYDAELHLTRLTSMNFYEVYSDHHVPTTVNTFDEIGSAFNFSVKVMRGSFLVNTATLKIHIPNHTEGNNPLFYVTAVHTSQDTGVHCDALINPYKIGEKSYAVSFRKENFRAVKE
ncbi:hypothetical protein lerEdw1_001410, partial [Lerista edwardsae]